MAAKEMRRAGWKCYVISMAISGKILVELPNGRKPGMDKLMARAIVIVGVLLAIGMSIGACLLGSQARHIGSGLFPDWRRSRCP